MEISTANPFTGSFDIRVIRTYYSEENLRKLFLKDADGKKYYEYEVDRGVAIWRNEPFMQHLLYNARPITLRLYLHIIYNLIKKDRDFIDLKVKDAQELLKIGRMAIYAGIEQLCEFKLLAPRKGRNVYWINPQLLFYGSRIDYMNEFAEENVIVVKNIGQK